MGGFALPPKFIAVFCQSGWFWFWPFAAAIEWRGLIGG